MALLGNYKTPDKNRHERMFPKSEYIVKPVERGHLSRSLAALYILPAYGSLCFHEARMTAECNQNPFHFLCVCVRNCSHVQQL